MGTFGDWLDKQEPEHMEKKIAELENELEESRAIRIGSFTLSNCSNGGIWIEHDLGDGMQAVGPSLSALESILEQFWEANF